MDTSEWGTRGYEWEVVNRDNGFARDVESIVGPSLAQLGFVLDEIDSSVDEGGRPGSVVYYRSSDCKIQIYNSSREGNINCMIAPLDAPNNSFGLNRRKSGSFCIQDFPKPSQTCLS